MINIIDYVAKFGNKTFEEMPFNNVDSLIFAELSMINFELILKPTGKNTLPLKEIVFGNYKKIIHGSPDARSNGIILKKMMKSSRYQDVYVGYPRRIFGEELANQFYAVTFILPDGSFYISYRGTDITIVGWREDLYLTFMDSILSQHQALQYCEDVANVLPGNFILGGHSKGGNLAMFTASNLKSEYNDRLLSIYSFDGPGFSKGLDSFPNYPFIKDKIHKFLTHRDFVGLVYNNIEDYKIVYATGVLLGGHDPFTWKVNKKTGEFVFRDRCSKRSMVFSKATNLWLDRLTVDEKVLGCNALIAMVGRAKDIYGLLKYFFPNAFRLHRVMKKFPKKDRDRLKGIVISYFQCYRISKKSYSRKSKKIEKKRQEND